SIAPARRQVAKETTMIDDDETQDAATAAAPNRRTTAATRRKNQGLRKLCGCSRRNWAKCSHPWHFNFKLRGGRPYRFSLDAEVGKHLATKEEAVVAAENIRKAIREGRFVRAAERRQQASAAPAVTAAATTLEAFGEKFIAGKSQASGKKTWTN